MTKKYIVYKTTNIINGMIYVGVHSGENSKYLGSGTNIRKAIKQYGKESFIREILFEYDNKEDMLLKEAEIVNKDFISRKDTYNISIGGGELYTLNMITVKDGDSFKLISLDEFDSNIHQTNLTGKVNVIVDGKHKLITSKEYAEGVYNTNTTGIVIVKDPNNSNQFIKVSQEEFKRGDYKTHIKGLVSVKDPNDLSKTIQITKEEFSSGNYEGVTKGRTVARLVESGELITVLKTDIRFSTGELVGHTSGKKWVNKNKERKLINKHEIEEYLNNNWKLGKGRHSC